MKLRTGILLTFAGLVVGIAALLLVARSASAKKLGQTIAVDPATLTLAPATPALVAKGKNEVAVRGCKHCHGENLAGQMLENKGAVLIMGAPNITPGGQAVKGYTDRDWARVIRHGLNREGKPLLLMPVDIYQDMSDEDVGAIVAYLRTLEPVRSEVASRQIRPIGNFLVMAGMLPVPALDVDHKARPFVRTPGVSVENGKYLSRMCSLCHGSDMGGIPPGLGVPPGSNLTPSGNVGRWSEAEFVAFMRSGITPDKRAVSPMMPWVVLKDLPEEDLRSLYVYFRSLPPKQQGAAPADPAKKQ